MQRDTKAIAEFISGTTYEQLDADSIEMAKRCIIDFVGTAIAGARLESAQILKHYFCKEAIPGNAVLLDDGFEQIGTSSAAAINAAFGHADDMDDVHNESITHLGAVTVPTALALGQELHCSGKDIILAVVLGYDAGARVGRAILPESYTVWHTTAVAGPFSSAAAAACLLKLTPEQTVYALGNAGTQAGGLWAFLKSGAMSKLLHVANANLCGIRAAELSLSGFTGATDILESSRGFVAAMSGKTEVSGLTDSFGAPFLINRNSFKPYACCRHTHSAVYGTLCMKERFGINADEVAEIVDYTYQIAKNLTDNPMPENAYSAKFSVQYCIASALTRSGFNADTFSDKAFGELKVHELMAHIKVVADAELEADYRKSPAKWAHRLHITMKDNTVYDELFVYPYGDYNNPMDLLAIEEKFRVLTSDRLSSKKADLILSRIKNLEEVEDINTLFQW